MPYVHGRITDDGIAELRKRIGVGFAGRQPWRTQVTRDTIWHMAYAMSDLNELYTDPEYARRSKWGRQVCPGVAISCYDTLRAVGSAGTVSGLPGVHSIWTGSHYEWERPLFEGDAISSRSYLAEVTERQSKFGGGRSVYQTYEARYDDQNGAYLGRRTDTWIRIEREKTAKTAKYGGGERLAKWTEEDIERFRAEYRAHERTRRRGWEEVKVGDLIPRLIKGPHTATAEVALEAYFGFYLMGNQVAYQAMDRHPKLFVPNEQGVPEPPQRIHWDSAFAQKTLGLPGAYDLGLGRLAWMYHSVTDWMGDDSVVRMLDVEFRGFLYLGDVTWCCGKVTGKHEKDGKCFVDLDIWTVNHLDERTTIGKAQVEMPRAA
jgi:acyl dehydratase